MQQFAEYGVAAHWRYKEGSSQDQAMENTIAALRSLLENPVADEQLLEQLKPDYLNDRIYVLTPKGEVVDLTPQATALDFAYFVHSEVGHHCIGATVDGQRVPLSYPLKSGERINILTDPSSTPKLSWLSHKTRYFTTSRTAANVRSWLNNHYKHTDTAQLISSELVRGVGGREIIASLCCQPKLGERIVGVYQSDTSVVVHSSECPNAAKSKHDQPILELDWGEKTNTIRQTIHIKAFDRQGLLQDLTTLMNQAQVNILQINSTTDTDDQSVSMDLLIELGTEDELHHLFRRIEYIPNVFEASVSGE
jgi:GTP pyrophosphokinase